MHTMQNLLAVIAATTFLGGCVVTTGLTGPGDKPSETPPQLVYSKDARGNIWDRPSAFGPVPANLQSAGNMACRALGDTFIASGYHAQAKDANGSPLPGGGYYCVPKE